MVDYGSYIKDSLKSDYNCFTTTVTNQIGLSELVRIHDRLLYFATLLSEYDPDNKENNLNRSQIIKNYNRYLTLLLPNAKMKYNVWHVGEEDSTPMFEEFENTSEGMSYINVTTEE